MPNMTKEQRAEIKQHFEALKEFCCTDGKGWDKAYLITFLEAFENTMFPKQTKKTTAYYDEQVENWLNLMAYCEYRASFDYIANKGELDNWFVDMVKKIRNKE